jgi:hypothetical protein
MTMLPIISPALSVKVLPATSLSPIEKRLLRYSYLSATSGSTLVARRAGR